jgi:hypothetical protein
VRGLLAVARFRSPLIKPDVRISRIRLSDWISPPGSRTRPHPDSTQWNNAQPAVDRIPREAGISAARPHLMTPPEVMPYAFVDIIVDRLICLCRRAVAEICAPTSQNLIQSIPHLRPHLDVVRHQKISHFLLDTRYTLLGRTRSQIPTAIRLEAMWAERISQKIKAVFARLLDAGLCFIQGKSQSCDYPTRPIQCLDRFPATQDHEIVRIGDHMSLELLSPLGVPPTLQQTVDIQVSEQWAGYSSNANDNFSFERTVGYR